MNVTIYCASTNTSNENIYKYTIELGEYLASLGCSLVYGGTKSGLMNVISDAFLNNNQKVIGVMPDVASIKTRLKENLTEYVYTDSLSERKAKMIELADLIIALPGGPGTLDELSEVINLIRIKEINKKLLIYNMDNYYDPLESLLNNYVKNEFLKREELGNVIFVRNIEDIKKIIQNEKK